MSLYVYTKWVCWCTKGVWGHASSPKNFILEAEVLRSILVDILRESVIM